MATRPRKPTTEIQAQWTPPQQRASSTARPSSPQWPRPPSADGDYEHYEAHWGTIFLVLCALPGTLFVLANPVSLFIEGWLLFMAILATFVPKVVYFIMLEYAILNGNGSVFFHSNHTKRMSESSRSSSITRRIVSWAEMFGGVEGRSREQVAYVSKLYSASPPPFTDRIWALLGYLIPEFIYHAKICCQVTYSVLTRWVAFNILLRMYSRTRRSNQVQNNH